MTRAPLWLPDALLESPALAAPFHALLHDWCAHWFVRGKWAVGAHWSSKPGEGTAMIAPASGVAIAPTDNARLAVAAAMLDLPLDKATPRNADARLIDAIAGKALADFGERLAQLMPMDEAATGAGFPLSPPRYFMAVLDTEGREVLTLQAERATLIDLARSLAPAPRTKPAPKPRRTALNSFPVKVGAKIGAIHLPLADLKTLGGGDVLTFNQPVDAALNLTVNGAVGARDALKLRSDDRHLYLEMTRSLA